MIRALVGRNFQSWKEVRLEFSNGVNAIVGTSDSGKTALLRIIEWIVRNRPLGDSFRSHWGGITLGTLRFDTDVITRLKDKDVNQYLLNTNSQIFNAIKQEVPEEIQRIINMNEINLQKQLDAPFLLSNSPGEVGAHFNRIAHLDVIDIGTQNVQKWKRSIEQDIRSGEQYLQQQREELKKYAHLNEFEQRLQILETLDEQRISLYQKRDRLAKLNTDIIAAEKELEVHKGILEIEAHVNSTLKLMAQKRHLLKQYEELGLNIDRLGRMEKATIQLQEKTKNAGKITDLLKLNDQRAKLKEKYIDLKSIVDSAHNSEALWLGMKERHHTLEQEFNRVMPDVCPLCGRSG